MEEKIRWYKQGQALLSDIRESGPGPALVWFLGQHSFALNLGGKILYIDVILNDFLDAQGKSTRRFDAPFGPQEPQKADYVLCTHDHSDHLNLETLIPLAKASPNACFIVPNPSRNKLIKAGIDESRVIGAKAGEKIALGGLIIHPVPAIHTRFIQDEPEQDNNGDCTCLGLVVEGGGIKIYHPGDTWVTPRHVWQ
jgi:L-ascorbate metabolism protein UlaG (beta-lactamase superfamily)